MSLVAQNEFDSLFGTLYTLCCAIDMSMVASRLERRLGTRGIRERAKEQGKTFDGFEEAIEWQSRGVDLGAKFDKFIGRKNRKDADAKIEEGDTMAGEEEASLDLKDLVPNAVV
ncbi:hypothetical protein CC80DRAFT_556032 [Byssothecium circinans]|uniref:Uncharacterized protein n=1 Tax=Byssothecium circinans TaxID=147558 RepID=A0A6A5T976_9PLEO|nr:hypothetical protein CC80DRAFT_556032 [Byssothecium circinans]